MEETINLQDIVKILIKRFKLILGITVAAVLIAAFISFFILTPIYQSSTQILVNQKQSEQQNQIQSQEIQANLQLINTYNVIIKSPTILNKVIDELDLNTSASDLADQITVTNENNSQVVNITVQDENAARAVEIANTVADVFESEVKKLINIDNVNILSPAELPDNPSPVKPNKMLNMAIALVVGLLVSVGVAFVLEYLDTTVKTEKDIEELINIPILGYISKMPDSNVNVGVPSTLRTRRTVRSVK